MKNIYLYKSRNKTLLFYQITRALLFIILFLPATVLAQELKQEWTVTLGQPDRFYNIFMSPDQQPVTLANADSSSIITKLNSEGSIVWFLELKERLYEIEFDAESNAYLLGNSLTKISSTGEIQWTIVPSQYGLARINTIKVSENGDTYAAGNKNENEILLLKFNPEGELVWTKAITKDNREFASLELVIGDELYMTYSRRKDGFGPYFTLLKLDTHTADIIYSKDFINETANGGVYRAMELLWHDSNRLYVVMEKTDHRSSPAVFQGVAKLDENGNLLWEKDYDFEVRDYYYDAILDKASNIYLLTISPVSSEPYNSYVAAKIDTSGNEVWDYRYSPAQGSRVSPSAIAALPTGEVAVLGGGLHLFSPDGNLLELKTDIPGSGLVNDESGNLYLAGGKRADNETGQVELIVGKYSVTTGCEALTLTARGGLLDCNTNTLKLYASSPIENATYSWTGPEGFTSDEQFPIVSAPGRYTVTVNVPETDCVLSADVEVHVPNYSTGCYIIDFEQDFTGLISSTYTNAGQVSLIGKNRRADGTYAPENHAAIFETGMPTGDDDDLHTLDWGKALIINQDLGEEPNDNRWGGELILDFTNIGPVTLNSLKALDIDEYEDDSWVYLYDANGKELFKTQLQPLGNNSQQEVLLGNTKGVMKVRIVLNGTEGLVGSGAIDDIKFCVEEVVCEEAKPEESLVAYAAPTLFSDKTTIAFEATEAAPYTVTLHDLRGNLIGELATGTTIAGETKEVEVDGTALPNGMYIARIISGSKSKAVKLILRR